MQLMTLEKRREKGDLITICKLVNQTECVTKTSCWKETNEKRDCKAIKA